MASEYWPLGLRASSQGAETQELKRPPAPNSKLSHSRLILNVAEQADLGAI